MSGKMTRREFFQRGSQIGILAALGIGASRPGSRKALNPDRHRVDVAVVCGNDPDAAAEKAVEELGGIRRFVPKDARVAVLVNSQSRHPGTYTKPKILRALIRMCREAGASEVNCLTWLTEEHWGSTGLAAAAREEGARLRFVPNEEAYFRKVPVPGGKILDHVMLMKELQNNDVLIDVPITKDHAGNRLTGTMKNLMGLNCRAHNRLFHKPDWKTNPSSIQYFDQCIVDLNKTLKPDLCVVDATEFITTNGPFGPGKILRPQKVVAGVDRVALDAYCSSLWGLKPEDIAMIRLAAEQGLGEMDLEKVRIRETSA